MAADTHIVTGSTWVDKIIPLALPAFLLSGYGTLALQPELRLVVPMLVGVSALLVLLLALAAYLAPRLARPWSPRVILSVALLIRLMFISQPPQLSDDIFRYLWDGSNLVAGTNPYAAPPALQVPAPELKSIHTQINHPDYVTIYPPMAQLVFACGAATGYGIVGLKAVLVLLDLGLCALLLAVLRQLGLPAWLALLYAWNPLPVIEIAGSGHVDGAGLAFLLASIYLILKGGTKAPGAWQVPLAGVFFAGACLVKLFPLVLIPVLFLLVPAQRRGRFATAFLLTLCALMLAFLPQLANSLKSLDAYARNWEFAGFAFNVLRSLTGSGNAARMLLSSSFLGLAAYVTWRLCRELGPEQDAAQRWRLALQAAYRITLALLLTTPTLQPWYALSLAALLPFAAGPEGLVLCWAVFLTYRVQIPYYLLGQWIESLPVTAAVFCAPVVALFSGWIGQRMRRGVSAEPD
jgi:hypothetical protein